MKAFKIIVSGLVIASLLLGGALAAGLGDKIDGYDAALGTGMELSRGVYWTGSDYQTENYIEYTPSEGVYPVVVSGSKLCNYGNFSSMAKLLENAGKHVICGINGDYFNTANYELLGIVVQDGELWSSDAGLHAVGFKTDGTTVFGLPALSTSLKLGDSVYIMDSVNKTRKSPGATIYTDKYSAKTKNTGEGVDVICTPDSRLTTNCEVKLTVDEVLTEGGSVAIPEGKVIISVSANALEALFEGAKALAPGDTVTLSISCAEQWQGLDYAIGSLYKLVSAGQVVAGLPAGTAPRTAIGMRADGSLVLYTNDGRQSGHSVGISMTALANRMIELGCVEATIMDGGGSTSLNAIYLGDESVSQINSPSDGRQRSVSNYIMLVTDKKPTGKASQLALYPLSTNLLAGATEQFYLKAADENGYAAAVPAGFGLNVSEGLGTIGMDGVYTATGEGVGAITATGEGLSSASVKVNVVRTPDILRVFYEGKSKQVTSLEVELGAKAELMAQAMDNYVYLKSQDSCFSWSVTGNIGSIDAEGTFTAGSEPGEGSIVVSAGDKTVSIPVTVRKPGLFDDVARTDWFYDAAQYVGENSLMTGTSERVFSPNTSLTRAMAVTVLYRMENSPAGVAYNGEFSDVAAEDWFAGAVAWASANGLVTGNSDGSFAPNAPITREQLATILWRYRGTPAGAGSLEGFTDAPGVSQYAIAAMQWAVGESLISGMGDKTVAPQGTATRAQMATLLMRLLSK